MDGPNDPDSESIEATPRGRAGDTVPPERNPTQRAGSGALTEDEISGLIESFFDRPIGAIWCADDHSPREHRTGLSVEEVRASLAEIIEQVTGIESSEVTIDKVLIDDLGIDTLSAVEIAARIEDRHCIHAYDEGFIGLRTIGDAITYIQRTQTAW